MLRLKDYTASAKTAARNTKNLSETTFTVEPLTEL